MRNRNTKWMAGGALLVAAALASGYITLTAAPAANPQSSASASASSPSPEEKK
jgi:hypothetical protein